MDETPRGDGACGGPRARRRPHRRGHRERKERILHTRISEPLAEDIRRMADELRVPVSNLVRNVLEEAFSVVEAVSDNVGDLIEEVVEEAERARERIRRQHRRAAPPRRRDVEDVDAEPRREFPDVIGWQPLILNREDRCADCGAALARGERAYAGATGRGLGDVILCAPCTDARP